MAVLICITTQRGRVRPMTQFSPRFAFELHPDERTMDLIIRKRLVLAARRQTASISVSRWHDRRDFREEPSGRAAKNYDARSQT